ncbi:MAG: molybdopterin-synthase adenylyltransferase [Blastocatellia bacterium]
MDRYTRQKMIKGWDQQALEKGKVLVVGAGTTGNEVIKNLVLLGVGNITIVDTDVVEVVNLNRSILFREKDINCSKSIVAAERARELNPGINAVGWDCNVIYKVGSLQYGNFDCVVLTVDNLEARLWVNRYCWLNGVPLIDTGIEGLIGNVFVSIPPYKSCIECGWGKREYQRLSDKYSCLKRGLDEEVRKIPMVITTAALIGGIASQECVAILHKHIIDISKRAGKFFQYDGDSQTSIGWHVPKKEDCPAHSFVMGNSHALLDASLDENIESLKQRIARSQSASAVEIWCDKEVVYSVVCSENCGYTRSISPLLLGEFKREVCPYCHKLSVVPHDYTEELKDGWTLKALGIPSNHLLRVAFGRGDEVYEGWIVSR